MEYVIGVDCSASQNVYALADIKSGVISQKREVPRGAFYKAPNSPDSAPRVLDSYRADLPVSERTHTFLAEGVECFLKDSRLARNRIRGIGISLAGKTFSNGRDGRDVTFLGGNTPERFGVDIGNGKIGINVTKSLRAAFPRIPVVGGNDCNCTGNAQSFVYGLQGLDPLKTFYITISTGIGGGGPKDDVDEVGHMVVGNIHPALDIKCGCGVTNCLEAHASGSGIAKVTRRILSLFREDREAFASYSSYEALGGRIAGLEEAAAGSVLFSVFDSKKKKGEVFTAKEVFQAMNEGDPLAQAILGNTARMTAQVIEGVAQLHDLERIGIGGGVGENNPNYVAMIQNHLNRILVPGKNKMFPAGVVVEIGPLGTVANDYGALSLVVPEEHRTAWAQTMLSLKQREQA